MSIADCMSKVFRGTGLQPVYPKSDRTIYLCDHSGCNAGMFRQTLLCNDPNAMLLSGMIDLSSFLEPHPSQRSLILEIRMSLLRPLVRPYFNGRLSAAGPKQWAETVQTLDRLRQIDEETVMLQVKFMPKTLAARALHLRWSMIGRFAERAPSSHPDRYKQ